MDLMIRATQVIDALTLRLRQSDEALVAHKGSIESLEDQLAMRKSINIIQQDRIYGLEAMNTVLQGEIKVLRK